MSNPTHCEVSAVDLPAKLTDEDIWARYKYARAVNSDRPNYIGMSLGQSATYNVTFGWAATIPPERIGIRHATSPDII